MENLNVKFQEKFGIFESYVKQTFGVNKLYDDIFDIMPLRKNSQLWKKARNLRNIYSHGGLDFVYINKESLEEFCNEVDKLVSPKTVLELAIKDSNVYKVTKEEYVLSVINSMVQNNYTCTPVVNEQGKVIGVFSADSLMNFISVNSQVIEDFSQITISDFMNYCELDSCTDVEYIFVSKKTKENEIRNMFKATYEENKRLEMIFVTDRGHPEEKLLGIFTHWDLQV